LPIAGAILDVNLVDGDISPVAEQLIEAGIPIIVQTGIGLPPRLAARFPDLPVHIKPCVAAKLVAQLEAMIAATGEPHAASSATVKRSRA